MKHIKTSSFLFINYYFKNCIQLKTRSIASNSSAVKDKAFKLSRLLFSCPTELAPINTEVILLSLSNQAKAI